MAIQYPVKSAPVPWQTGVSSPDLLGDQLSFSDLSGGVFPFSEEQFPQEGVKWLLLRAAGGAKLVAGRQDGGRGGILQFLVSRAILLLEGS